MKKIIVITIGLFLLACGDETLPKPKAFLRLEYPDAVYKKAITPLPFTFQKNQFSKPISEVKIQGNVIGLDVNYPKLKGTIYLSYNRVRNNLDSLLIDAQNRTQKHTVKANAITNAVFENKETNVYGMFYEIGGNAASQAQFYVTDSTKHFLSGSLYFYVKPNYDSIYPASEYLKKDIKHLMETVKWLE